MLMAHNGIRMGYQLVTDSREIGDLTSMRVMVASALLYTYCVHYLFVGVVYVLKARVKVERMYDHGRRLVLYGIAALLSISFLNYGVYHAILAWVTLICVLIMHVMAMVPSIKENYHNIAVTFYYILIAAWFFGILFFYMFNALNDD